MRYALAENPYIWARFNTGDNPTVSIYDASDDSVIVNAAAMSELAATGHFKYLFDPSPVALTNYFYIASTDDEEISGAFTLGGYPDEILERIATLTSGTAAVNTVANNAPNGFVITSGTGEVNDEDSTHEEDGIYHSILPDGGEIDVYYIFDVGVYGIPVSAKWTGYLNSQGDLFSISAWNWVKSVWEKVGEAAGTPSTSNISASFDLTTSHVGTGGDVGKVHMRGHSTNATKLATDRFLCSYAIDVTSTILDMQGTGFAKDVDSLVNIKADTNDIHDEAFGKWDLDPTAKTLTLYESDGVTPLKVFDLTSTTADVPAFIGRTPQ